MMQEDVEASAAVATASPDLSALVIPLLKGVIYQEADAGLWNALLTLQSRVRDYVAVLDLELVLDEAEGYTFLRAPPEAPDGAAARLPRLVARRPLSFPVSLLLALLRRKLAEFDAGGGDAEQIVIAGNDEFGIRRERRGDHMIVVGVARYDALTANSP